MKKFNIYYNMILQELHIKSSNLQDWLVFKLPESELKKLLSGDTVTSILKEEAPKKVKKIVVRDGKRQTITVNQYRTECPDNYKRNSEGKCERMSAEERRNRSVAATKAANKSSTKRNKAISARRRSSLFSENMEIIKITSSALIRLLEYAREEVDNDVRLHELLEDILNSSEVIDIDFVADITEVNESIFTPSLRFLECSKKVKEVLSKNSTIQDWIEDFMKSDAPQFKGKSEEKRREMAIAAYYSSK